ncbi:NUDIX domain-containing protein [Aestuariibius sp. 2305UL40-4]|uniref:NUDIX domain-containing protein n=1 Tax=Aestuariibius violaceus TaxID=3234132 RepID=UPI00345E9267
MIRRYGEIPRRGQRYRTRPGVYAVLPMPSGVLLTVQAGDEPELQLPGGGVDPGEQPVRALHREVYEETGWLIARPRRLGAFRRFTWMPEYELWAEKICAVYVADPVRALGPPLEADHVAVVLPVEEAAVLLDDVCGGAAVRELVRTRLAV